MAQQVGTGRIQVFENLNPREQRSMLVGVLILVALVMGVVNTVASGDTDWAGLADNFSTELMGAALTFFIFDVFQERRSDLQRKEQLIRELGSRSNDTAISALDEIRKAGMDKDGSLRGADLAFANLEGADLLLVDLKRADLASANLAGTLFGTANLQEVNLQDAILGGANLIYTDLKGANLIHADLKGADLMSANLAGADLRATNLEGTDLNDANLLSAELEFASFDEETILPDQTKWTSDTDMNRFTDPEHSRFWRSDWQPSPAYRGDKDE